MLQRDAQLDSQCDYHDSVIQSFLPVKMLRKATVSHTVNSEDSQVPLRFRTSPVSKFWAVKKGEHIKKEENNRKNTIYLLIVKFFSDSTSSNSQISFNLKSEKVYIKNWKIFLVCSSKERARVSARVLLIPVSVGQPNTQDLREAEEEADATDKSQDFASVFPDDGGTGRALLAAFHTASQASVIWVKASKSAAV